MFFRKMHNIIYQPGIFPNISSSNESCLAFMYVPFILLAMAPEAILYAQLSKEIGL